MDSVQFWTMNISGFLYAVTISGFVWNPASAVRKSYKKPKDEMGVLMKDVSDEMAVFRKDLTDEMVALRKDLMDDIQESERRVSKDIRRVGE